MPLSRNKIAAPRPGHRRYKENPPGTASKRNLMRNIILQEKNHFKVLIDILLKEKTGDSGTKGKKMSVKPSDMQ